MRAKVIWAGVAALAMLFGSGMGHATETHACGPGYCTASDANPFVAEPILNRSQVLPVTTGQVSLAENKLANANITSFKLSAVNGVITATIRTLGPIVRDAIQVAEIFPYQGQHLLVLFQTPDFEQDQVIGQNLDGSDAHWVPPGRLAEGYRWFVSYGWNDSENRETCTFGYYDPYAEYTSTIDALPIWPSDFILTPILPGYTKPTIRCSISRDRRTLTISVPYVFGYTDRTGQLQRRLRLIRSGEIVENASAVSFMDQEIGGPDPIGLIEGRSWPCDAVPSGSYDRGLVNYGPSVVQLPNGHEPLPTGARFVDSHLDFVAA